MSKCALSQRKCAASSLMLRTQRVVLAEIRNKYFFAERRRFEEASTTWRCLHSKTVHTCSGEIP